MPDCEVCGEQVDMLYRCKNCGTRFCEDDGSVAERLCNYCLEEEGFEEEEEFEEEKEEEDEEEEDYR